MEDSKKINLETTAAATTGTRENRFKAILMNSNLYSQFLIKPSQNPGWTSPLDIASYVVCDGLIFGSWIGYQFDVMDAYHAQGYNKNTTLWSRLVTGFKTAGVRNARRQAVFFVAYDLLTSVLSNAVYQFRGEKRYIMDDIATAGFSAVCVDAFRVPRFLPLTALLGLSFAGIEALDSKLSLERQE